MEILGIIFAALIGMAVGSFLNVCIDRLPADRSIVHPPSFCDSCETPLAFQDMVPVFSYMLLRGKCRICGAHIPLRVPIVEIAGGIIFALNFWQYGMSPQFAVFTFYFMLLLLIFFIDLEQHLILNKVVYPAAIVALVLAVIMPQWGVAGVPQPAILWLPEWLPQPEFIGGLPSAVIGGVVGFTFLFIPALVYPAGMGWGDVKFAGLMGLMTGLANVFVALLLGIVMGGVVAAILLVSRRKNRREGIPFGPFLAMGTAVALLWGQDILNWYLAFFAF